MEQLSLVCKKIFPRALVIFFVCMLTFGTLAQATLAQSSTAGTQANTYTNGNASSSGTQISSQAIIGGIGSCVASLIGNEVSGLISTLVAKYAGSDAYLRVGTTAANDVARAGDSNGYYPSLDSIGYCIINAVLAYLTQATIDWINSGFDGNPAFVDNPEKFFGDIADIETGSFLQQIVASSTGINICQPFKLNIVTGLGGGNQNGFNKQSGCSLDQISQSLGQSGATFDYKDYTSGSSQNAGNLDAWWNVTQNDQNNPYGAYYMAQRELQKRLAVKQNTANLDLTTGRGFLSFKKCAPDTTVTNGSGATSTQKGACKTSTPGSVIEEQLNNRLSSGNNRLVVADKFDQIITALVNQLIKIALNQVLDGSSSSGH